MVKISAEKNVCRKQYYVFGEKPDRIDVVGVKRCVSFCVVRGCFGVFSRIS